MSKIVVDRMVEDENGNEVFLKGKPELFWFAQPDGSFASVHGDTRQLHPRRRKKRRNFTADYGGASLADLEALIGRQMEVTTELDVPSGTYTVKDWKIK